MINLSLLKFKLFLPNCALIRLRIPGQSVLGEVTPPTTPSNVPAHASLWVKKLEDRLNIFFIVAGIEECSNSEFGAGPFGPLITEKKQIIISIQ
jgi:hypothetical protein